MKNQSKSNKIQKSKYTNLKRKGILILSVILALLALVQILFNLFVWQSLRQQSIFQTRTHLVNAIDKINLQKLSLTDGQKIPEARLLLPAEAKEIGEVRYLYTEPFEDQPANLRITTRDLEDLSQSLLNVQTHNQLFNKIEMVQACNRGTVVYIGDPKLEEGSQQKLIGKKTLSDGRDIYIIKETQCGHKTSSDANESLLYNMSESLDQYLAQIQSY